MCNMFSTIDRRDYAFRTRSVRLGGHATSIRLESMFWAILDEVAGAQNVTMGRFLSKLHDETMAFDETGRHNFASLLRCACLAYVAKVKGKAPAQERLKQSAARDFAATEWQRSAGPAT